MPPKRGRLSKARTDVPQPSTSSSTQVVGPEEEEEEEEDEEAGAASYPSNTQATVQSTKILMSLTPDVRQKKINDLVQFLLIMDQKKQPIKRLEINKVVLKEHKRAFLAFIKEAAGILREVFGFDLVEVDSKSKSYILVNLYEQDVEKPLHWSKKDNRRMSLVIIILSLIFMKGNVIGHDELVHFLEKLGIDLQHPHEAFGDVKKLIMVEFVKQGYLEISKIPNMEPLSHEYRWGFRARQEFSKQYALDFVCQIYGVDTPQDWACQYQDMEREQASNS